MISYILHCYPKNKNKTEVIERLHMFGVSRATPFVQNKLVHETLDDGFFVLKIVKTKEESV